MDIRLTPKLEKFVAAKVESGLYESASDVVREAIRRMAEGEAFLRQEQMAMNRLIEEGYRSLENGEGEDGDAFFERLLKEDELEDAQEEGKL